MASRDQKSTGTRTLHGIFWAYGSYVGGRGLSLVATAILARLLTPRDFGLVALALTFTTFLDLLQGSGISLALVVSDESELKERADTAFALSTGLGLIMGLVTAALGPVAAMFFHQPQLIAMAPAFGLNFLILGIGVTPAALAMKRIDFRSRTFAELAEALVRGVIGVVLALLGAGVWSLVIGYVVGTAAWAIVIWRLVSFRPRLRIGAQYVRSLLRFGGALSGVNVSAAFMAQFDNLVVGRVLGATALGFYSIATRLPALLILNVASVAGRVLFPAFASLKERELERGFLTALRYTLLLALPLTVFLIIFADPLMVALFGDRWLPASPSMRVLSLWALMTTMGTIWGNAFLARSRPGILLKLAVPQATALIIGSLVFVHQGIVAVSWVQASIAVVAQIAVILIARRMFSFSFRAVVRAVSPPVLASAGLAAELLIVHLLISSPWPAILVAASTGAVAYFGLLMVLAPDALRRLYAMAYPGRQTVSELDTPATEATREEMSFP